MEVKTLTGLILAAIALGLLVLLIMNIREPIEEGKNIAAVQNWVMIAGKETEASGGIARGLTSKRPPVTKLYGPILIDSNSDFKRLDYKTPPKVQKSIADAMIDCWAAFDKGETPFLGAIGDPTRFCFPCVGIQFSEQIKVSKPRITGIQEFLKTNKIGTGSNSLTYYQYLTNGNTEIPVESLISNELPTENDLYVYFIAGKKSYWDRLKEKPLYAYIVPATAIGTAVYTYFTDETYDFRPQLIVGDPKIIIKACSEE